MGIFAETPFGSDPFAAFGDDGIQLITESLLIDPVLTPEQITILVELMNVLDEPSFTVVYALREQLFAADNMTAAASYLSLCSELVALAESVRPVFDVTMAESMEITPELEGVLIRIAAIRDQLAVIDTAEGLRSLLGPLTETLAALDVLARVRDELLNEEMEISEALDAAVLYYQTLLEQLNLTGDFMGMAVFNMTLTDDMDVTGDALTTTTFYGLLEEKVDFTVSLSLAGLPYLGIAMNATNKSITEYRPYAFNSLAKLNGRLYGAGADGLYRLEGADDAGVEIPAYVRTALARIAGGRKAHVDSAYLGYSSDGQVQLKVITTETTGTKTSRVYELKAQTADTNRAGRIKLGKGVQSVYWAFELSNVLGSDFTIDVIELRVLALSRRV